ncbi:MAG: AAA family ATPase [Myxococcales bacterium]|nr:AAA family ATPase [Myxococcales bacterium]
MRIERLRLINYRGFAELDLAFPPAGPTVFVGDNGSGKSTVLRALDRLTSQYQAGEALLQLSDIRVGSQEVVASIVYRRGQSRLTVAPTRQKHQHELAATTWSRHLAELPTAEPTPEAQGVYWATRHPAAYGAFIDWFRTEENAENELRLTQDPSWRSADLETVRLAWKRFMGELGTEVSLKRMRFTRVMRGAPIEGVFVVDKGDVTLTLDQLSDGEAGLLLMVGDYARALTTAPGAGATPLQGSGVVLVDELDLHLHPSWQRRLLPALQAAFPNTQIIGTTHSPLIVGHLLPENVVLLRDFQASHPSASQGRDARDILLEIMGTPSRSDEARALIQAVEQALDRDDLPAAKANLQALEAMTGADDPAVLRLGTELFVSEP